MPNAVPLCTHVKTNGEVCGSPAVSGTPFCYHHSAVKTALGKAPNRKAPVEGFAPIPFLFPEDRASIQINFFLLLQAFNEQRIDQKTYRLMLSMLKAMAKNLGRSGSLVDQEQGTGTRNQEGREPTSQKRDVGHPQGGETDGLEALLNLKASAAIAPESCFSMKPRVQASDTNRDLFRISTLALAGYGFHQAAQPLTR